MAVMPASAPRTAAILSAAVLSAAVLFALAGCTGVPSPEQKAATDLNPSGRPVVGPSVTRVTTPPGDIDTFDPVNCRIEGQGYRCGREGEASDGSAAIDAP